MFNPTPFIFLFFKHVVLNLNIGMLNTLTDTIGPRTQDLHLLVVLDPQIPIGIASIFFQMGCRLASLDADD